MQSFHIVRQMAVPLLLAGASISPAAAQPTHHTRRAPAHSKEFDDAVAAGVAQMKALQTNAEAQRAAVSAKIDAYEHPDDSEARDRATDAEVAADRAQTTSDKSICSSHEALATRMRSASVQEQNYLTTLCSHR